MAERLRRRRKSAAILWSVPLKESIRLKVCFTGNAGVGDHVANVGHTRDLINEPLEAQAKAGMRHGAVAAQVQVPAVVFLIQVQFIHPAFQNVQALFTL